MNELAERIWKYGTYLVTIEYYAHKVNLYTVDAEFYEIHYNNVDNEIEKINLATEDDLKKYLSRIELEKLQ
ncbi:MAG TPA: hypothetical protein VGQ59_03015 [Cyclobacteriaceae bacterium]|jgi:hypothetical protein|nr:hypothetical protein [Cyclobacteriaceae bacterium]